MLQWRPSVMLVDDEPDLLFVLQLHLEDLGYQVKQQSDSTNALTLLRQTPVPHIVLLDTLMPRLDGRHLLEAVAHDPVLAQRHRYAVMTGLYVAGLPPLVVPVVAQLAVPILLKPFDLGQLNATIAMLARQLHPANQPHW